MSGRELPSKLSLEAELPPSPSPSRRRIFGDMPHSKSWVPTIGKRAIIPVMSSTKAPQCSPFVPGLCTTLLQMSIVSLSRIVQLTTSISSSRLNSNCEASTSVFRCMMFITHIWIVKRCELDPTARSWDTSEHGLQLLTCRLSETMSCDLT